MKLRRTYGLLQLCVKTKQRTSKLDCAPSFTGFSFFFFSAGASPLATLAGTPDAAVAWTGCGTVLAIAKPRVYRQV